VKETICMIEGSTKDEPMSHIQKVSTYNHREPFVSKHIKTLSRWFFCVLHKPIMILKTKHHTYLSQY